MEGVLELKNGHFWQLDFNSIVGTIDVRVRRDADEQMVLHIVTEKLSTIVNNLTVQVITYVEFLNFFLLEITFFFSETRISHCIVPTVIVND